MAPSFVGRACMASSHVKTETPPKNILFFCAVPTGAAPNARARRASSRLHPSRHRMKRRPACVWGTTFEMGWGVGRDRGAKPVRLVGGTPGRTVDDESKRDGVHQDHHGHRSLAFTLGAFGTGVMDKFFIRASEKGAHVCHCRYARGDVRCGCDVHLVGASVLVGLNPILG